MSIVTPEASAQEIKLHEAPPRPTYALNRKRVLVVVSVITMIVAYLFYQNLSPTKAERNDEAKPARHISHPGEHVLALPNDYEAFLKKAKPTPAPPNLKENIGTREKAKLTEIEELLRQAKLKRVKNALAAREATAEFKNISARIKSPTTPQNTAGLPTSSSEPDVSSLIPKNSNSRDEDNRQDDKNAFLNEARRGDLILRNQMIPKLSKYQVSAGTVIPGLLLTGLNSDLPGQILGQVSQDIYDSPTGHHRVIPQGTKIIGTYDSRVSYGQERLLIVWTRLMFPNGSSLNLEGMPGVDLGGYAGLSDQVNNHYLKLLGGVVMTSVLGASALMAQGQTFETENPQFDQLALQGVAKETNSVGQEITRKNLNVQPTLEIRPGFRFNVFVTKDMLLKKYRE